jgi:glycosyltransferase involved in cell wall biosynthesis
MNDKPAALVDVLIPAYNVAETIESAVGSIQNQTVTDIRIVVVDDGSTDRTGEILASMAKADPRITVITTTNGGIVDALNRGLSICTAEFIARHDGDDLAFPERFSAQLEYLQKHSDCVAVGSNAVHIDEHGKRTGTRSRLEGDVAPDPYWVPSKEPYLMHPFLMVRREAILKVGGYRHVYHAEDTDLYWRLLDVGRLHNLDVIHGEYRIHEGSISSSSVLNGRIAATNSQLAALSFLRRQNNQEDLKFEKTVLEDYKRGSTFRNVIDIASSNLTAEERRYLELSSATKLLSLMEYRPYLPDHDDCAFIGDALNIGLPTIDKQNRNIIGRLRGKAALKLAANVRLREIKYLRPTIENLLRAVVSDMRRKVRQLL